MGRKKEMLKVDSGGFGVTMEKGSRKERWFESMI